jgi:uncharacterized protein with HEPN domain
MRPDERDAQRIREMIGFAREALEYTAGLSLAEYLTDGLRRRAVERVVELIGEAAGQVSQEFRSAHSEIAWTKMRGQRNLLIHEYGIVDEARIYRLVMEVIPALPESLAALLEPSSR